MIFWVYFFFILVALGLIGGLLTLPAVMYDAVKKANREPNKPLSGYWLIGVLIGSAIVLILAFTL